jgi:hypothetical protein
MDPPNDARDRRCDARLRCAVCRGLDEDELFCRTSARRDTRGRAGFRLVGRGGCRGERRIAFYDRLGCTTLRVGRCDRGNAAAGSVPPYSLCSALGYAAGNRGAAVGGREAISADFDAAQKHEKDLRSRLATVANVRPAAVIEAEIARQRQDRLWMMSSECREATGATSRAFCKGVETLRAELEAAGEASGLRLELARVTAELATLRGKGAGLDADPQIASLSRLFGFSRERVTSAWSALFSVLTELGCAFVPFIGLTMLGVRHAPSSGASGGDSATIVGQGPGRGPALKKRKSWKWLGRRMTGLLELPPLRSVEFSEDGRVRITDQQ